MGSGLLQPTHLIVLLLIALVVLGPKRLPDAAKSLGHGLRGFKDSLAGNDDDEEPQLRRTVAQAPAGPAPVAEQVAATEQVDASGVPAATPVAAAPVAARTRD